MTRPLGRPLRGVCEALRVVLREHLPLTRFQLEVIVSPHVRETFVLVDPADATRTPREATQRGGTIVVPIKDDAGTIGTLTLEHRSVRADPRQVQQEVESVAVAYAPVLRACLGRGRRLVQPAGVRLSGAPTLTRRPSARRT